MKTTFKSNFHNPTYVATNARIDPNLFASRSQSSQKFVNNSTLFCFVCLLRSKELCSPADAVATSGAFVARPPGKVNK